MKLELVYFSVRARAEPIRMALAYGKLPYSDITPTEYYGSGWSEAKAKTPYGSLPVLYADGQELGQSTSILRFVAHLAGLVPSDPVAAAKCDGLCQYAEDMSGVNPCVNIFRGDSWTEKKEAFFKLVPPILDNLEKQLKGPFFLGDTPYYCDLAVYHPLSNARILEPTFLDGHPKLLAFMEGVEQLPGVKEYLAARPVPVDIGVAPKLQPRA